MDVEIDVPAPEGHDLLVEIRALSVDPADVKARRGRSWWHAEGVGLRRGRVVLAVGDAATAYAAGDEV